MTIHSINCDTLFFTGNRSGLNQDIHIGSEVDTNKIVMSNPLKSTSLETEKLKNGFDDTAIELNEQSIKFIKDIDFNNVGVSNFSGGGGGAGLPLSGDGDIAIGTGNISVANGTITSTSGDIQTGGTADIVSGRNFILDGSTIQKRIDNGGVITLTEYTTFKDCARKSSNNNFTTQQTFTDNILMSGTGKTLNNSQGSIVSGTGNIETIICGTVDCDNGGTNSVSATQYNLRTSSAVIDGWSLEQGDENSPAQQVDRVLQIKAGEAGGYITITPTDFIGTDPAIILDPNTTANGGKIYAGSYTFGTTADRYNLTQDLTGPLNHTLQITAPTASSKVEFRDNSNSVILDVKKGEVKIADDLPLLFGNYSFRPQQYSLTRTLTIAANPDTTNFTNMAFNCRSDTWTNVNAGGSVSLYNALLEGYYKCTITQTGVSSAGNFTFCDIIFDYVLHMSTQTDPDIIITEPHYGYRKKPTNQARPTIEIDHLNTPVQSQPVFVLYSGQSAGETMPIEVRLTKLNF